MMRVLKTLKVNFKDFDVRSLINDERIVFKLNKFNAVMRAKPMRAHIILMCGMKLILSFGQLEHSPVVSVK